MLDDWQHRKEPKTFFKTGGGICVFKRLIVLSVEKLKSEANHDP
jgi:hypothetical protein